MIDLPISVRSLYAKTYAKHGKTILLSKQSERLAYEAVEKKYGTAIVEKLKDFHQKNRGIA